MLPNPGLPDVCTCSEDGVAWTGSPSSRRRSWNRAVMRHFRTDELGAGTDHVTSNPSHSYLTTCVASDMSNVMEQCYVDTRWDAVPTSSGTMGIVGAWQGLLDLLLNSEFPFARYAQRHSSKENKSARRTGRQNDLLPLPRMMSTPLSGACVWVRTWQF